MNTLFKISLITVLLVGFSYTGKGQENLVPNPSFEDTVSCPTTLADLSAATFWSAPTDGSPDYFNSCTSNSSIDVPNNLAGSQLAFSGNAYIGIAVYDTQSIYSYREYIQVQLQQVLVSGQQYWMSFYVSLADTAMYAIQEIGAYFSPNQINDNSMDSTLSYVPQVEFGDSVITDKNGWTKIKGSFTATGNENYLIIGNFNRSQNTTALQVNSNNNDPYAYYYIDNICISNDSSYCANYIYTGIEEEPLKDNFNIYPNPINNYFHINQAFPEPYDFVIYNALGQKLFEEKNITEYSKAIDATLFNKGILFINIISNNKQINYKLLKQ